MTEDIIGRTAERELVRSISESEEVRGMDGTGTYNLYVFYKDIFPVANAQGTSPLRKPNNLTFPVANAQGAPPLEKPTILYFRWRCAWRTHPFPSRTRWLRFRRPMVLCWRRHGRAGGCRSHLKRKLKPKETIMFLLEEVPVYRHLGV